MSLFVQVFAAKEARIRPYIIQTHPLILTEKDSFFLSLPFRETIIR
jgi:hypothetical protein